MEHSSMQNSTMQTIEPPQGFIQKEHMPTPSTPQVHEKKVATLTPWSCVVRGSSGGASSAEQNSTLAISLRPHDPTITAVQNNSAKYTSANSLADSMDLSIVLMGTAWKPGNGSFLMKHKAAKTHLGISQTCTSRILL